MPLCPLDARNIAMRVKYYNDRMPRVGEHGLTPHDIASINNYLEYVNPLPRNENPFEDVMTRHSLFGININPNIDQYGPGGYYYERGAGYYGGPLGPGYNGDAMTIPEYNSMINGVPYHRPELRRAPGRYCPSGAFYSELTRNAEMPGGNISKRKSKRKSKRRR